MSTQLATRVGTILGGVASGLIPMGIFTPVYAIWPVLAWPIWGSVFFALAVGWSAYLVVMAVQLIRLSRELPHETNADDARISKAMAIIGGIQGGLILLSAGVSAMLGAWTLILPFLALVVGLHFFALPWVFGRTIDYYLGVAMLLVAGIGFYLSSQGEPWLITWGVIGAGGALVTSCYGLWMVLTARQTLRDHEAISAD